MKLRHPLIISCAARVLAGFIRCHLATQRFTEIQLGDQNVPTTPGLQPRYIYTFWHDGLILPASRYGGYDVHVLISQHADGQLIAETAGYLGYNTVRGSTTRGGREALRSLLGLERRNHVVITPDGPRGPRHVMQPGAIYLASRSGLPIVPVGVAFDRPWRAKSWDRFAIPKPFRRAVVVTDSGIVVPPEADRDELERYRQIIQERMDHVTQVAERAVAGETPVRLRRAA
ncbi:MAG: lysophospholipid acyltransferase family protein [Gemmataceae bacterium]|nr:lysophospholipid acyltransferase family protein [Gemmataceae bacterium]